MATTAKPCWLITGGSNGLGLALALHCLSRHIMVIATARDPVAAAAAHPELEERGGVWMELDVTAVRTTSQIDGIVRTQNVTCIVNAAGYASLGPIEHVTDDEAHAQFETNFHGVLRVIRGALWTFRSRGSGTIVNLSSAAGSLGRPGMGMYSASKAALESVSEALAGELAPFGVNVLIVVLGAFRTNMTDSSKWAHLGQYGETVTPVKERMATLPKVAKGDPAKAAKRIVDAVLEGNGGQLRLVLGGDSLALCKRAEGEWRAELDQQSDRAAETDIDE